MRSRKAHEQSEKTGEEGILLFIQQVPTGYLIHGRSYPGHGNRVVSAFRSLESSGRHNSPQRITTVKVKLQPLQKLKGEKPEKSPMKAYRIVT